MVINYRYTVVNGGGEVSLTTKLGAHRSKVLINLI